MASQDLLDIFGDTSCSVNSDVDNSVKTPSHSESPDPFGNIDFTGSDSVKSYNETIKDPQTIEQTLLTFGNDAPVCDGSDVTETLIGLNGNALYDPLPLVQLPQQFSSGKGNSEGQSGAKDDIVDGYTDTENLVDTSVFGETKSNASNSWEHQLGNTAMVDSLVDFEQTIKKPSPQTDSKPSDLLFDLDYPEAKVNGLHADISPTSSTEVPSKLTGDDPFGLFVSLNDEKSNAMDMLEHARSTIVTTDSSAVSNSDLLLSITADDSVQPNLSEGLVLGLEENDVPDGTFVLSAALSDVLVRNIEDGTQDLMVEAPTSNHSPTDQFEGSDTSHSSTRETPSLEDLEPNMQDSINGSTIITSSASNDYSADYTESLLYAGKHDSKNDIPSLHECEYVTDTVSAPAETVVMSHCVDNNINDGGGIGAAGYENVSTHACGEQILGVEIRASSDASGLDFPHVMSEKCDSSDQYSNWTEGLQKDMVEERDMEVTTELKIDAEKEAQDVLERILSSAIENVCDHAIKDTMEYLISMTETNSHHCDQEFDQTQVSKDGILNSVENALESLVHTVESNTQPSGQHLGETSGLEGENLRCTENVVEYLLSTTESNLQHSDQVPHETLDNVVMVSDSLKVENSEMPLHNLAPNTSDYHHQGVNLPGELNTSGNEMLKGTELDHSSQHSADESLSLTIPDQENVHNREMTEVNGISISHSQTPDITSACEPVDSLIDLVGIQNDSSGTQSQSTDIHETTTHFKSKQGSDDIRSTVLKPVHAGHDRTVLEADSDPANCRTKLSEEDSFIDAELLSGVDAQMSGVDHADIEASDGASASVDANTDCVTLPEVKHVTVDANHGSDTDYKVEGEKHLPEDIELQFHASTTNATIDIGNTPSISENVGVFDGISSEQDGSSDEVKKYSAKAEASLYVLLKRTETENNNNSSGESHENALNPDWCDAQGLPSLPTNMEVTPLVIEQGATATVQYPELDNGSLENGWQQSLGSSDLAAVPQAVDFGEKLHGPETDEMELLAEDTVDGFEELNFCELRDVEVDRKDFNTCELKDKASKLISPSNNPLSTMDASDNYDNPVDEKNPIDVLPSMCMLNQPEVCPDLVPSDPHTNPDPDTNMVGSRLGNGISPIAAAESHEDDSSVCDSLEGKTDMVGSPEHHAMDTYDLDQGLLGEGHHGMVHDSSPLNYGNPPSASEHNGVSDTVHDWTVDNQSSDDTGVERNAKPVLNSDLDTVSVSDITTTTEVGLITKSPDHATASDIGSPVQQIGFELQSLIVENTAHDETSVSNMVCDSQEMSSDDDTETGVKEGLQIIVEDGSKDDDIARTNDSGSIEDREPHLEGSIPAISPSNHQENVDPATNHIPDKEEFTERENDTAMEGGGLNSPPVVPLRRKKTKDDIHQSQCNEGSINEQVMELELSDSEGKIEKSLIFDPEFTTGQIFSVTDGSNEIGADPSMRIETGNDGQLLQDSVDFGSETAALPLEPNDLNDANKHLSTSINYSSVKFDEEVDFDAELGHSCNAALAELAVLQGTPPQGLDHEQVMDQGSSNGYIPSAFALHDVFDESDVGKAINSSTSGDTSASSEIAEPVVTALSTSTLDNKEEISVTMAERDKVNSDQDKPEPDEPEINETPPSHLETERTYFENGVSKTAEDLMLGADQTEETISIINSSVGVEYQIPSFMIDDVSKNPTHESSPSGHDACTTALESSNPPAGGGVQLDTVYNEEQVTRGRSMQNNALYDHESISTEETDESQQSMELVSTFVPVEDEHYAPPKAQNDDNRQFDMELNPLGGVELVDSCQVSGMEFDDDPYSAGMNDHATSITNEAIRRRNVPSKQLAPMTSPTGYISGHSYSTSVPSSVFIDVLSDSDSADDSLEVNTSSSGEENDSESDDNLYGSPVFDTPMLGFIEATNECNDSIPHPLSPYITSAMPGTYQGFDSGWEDIEQSQAKFIALPVIMEEPEPPEADEAESDLDKVAALDMNDYAVTYEDMEAEMDQIIDDVADTLVDIIEKIVCMETFHDVAKESDADYSDDGGNEGSFVEDSDGGSLEISEDQETLPSFTEDTSQSSKMLFKDDGATVTDTSLQLVSLPDEEGYDESLDGSNISVDGSEFSDHDFDDLSEADDSSEVESHASETDETHFIHESATDAQSESEFQKAPEAERVSSSGSKAEETDIVEPNADSENSAIVKTFLDVQIDIENASMLVTDEKIEPSEMNNISENLVRLAKSEALEELSQKNMNIENYDSVLDQETGLSKVECGSSGEVEQIPVQVDIERAQDEYPIDYDDKSAELSSTSSAEEDMLLQAPTSLTTKFGDRDGVNNTIDDQVEQPQAIAVTTEPQIVDEIMSEDVTAYQKITPQLGVQSLTKLDVEPSERPRSKMEIEPETFSQEYPAADSVSVDRLEQSVCDDNTDVTVEVDAANVPPPPPSRQHKPKLPMTVEIVTQNENPSPLRAENIVDISDVEHITIMKSEDTAFATSNDIPDDINQPPAPPTRKHKARKPVEEHGTGDSDNFESSEKPSNDGRETKDGESPFFKPSLGVEVKQSLHDGIDGKSVAVSNTDFQQSFAEDSTLLADTDSRLHDSLALATSNPSTESVNDGEDATSNHDVVQLTSTITAEVQKDLEHKDAVTKIASEGHDQFFNLSSNDISPEAKPHDDRMSSDEITAHTGMNAQDQDELGLKTGTYSSKEEDNMQQETRFESTVDLDSDSSESEPEDDGDHSLSDDSDSKIPSMMHTGIGSDSTINDENISEAVTDDTRASFLGINDDITAYCQEIVLGLLNEAFVKISNTNISETYESKEEESISGLETMQNVEVQDGQRAENESNSEMDMDFTQLTRSPGDGSEDIEGQLLSDSGTLEPYTDEKPDLENTTTEDLILGDKLETGMTQADEEIKAGETVMYNEPLKDSETVSIGSDKEPCPPQRIRHDTTGSLGSIRYLTDSEDEDEEIPVAQSTEGALVSLNDDDVDQSMPHTIITDFATSDEPLTTVQQRTKKKSLVPPSSLILSVALDDMPVADKQEPLPGVPVLEEDLIRTPSTPDDSRSIEKGEDSSKPQDVKQTAASTEVPTLILQSLSSAGESQPVVQTQVKLIKQEDIIPIAPMPSLGRKVEWEMVTVKNVDYKIDAAAIQPYKKVISHGGFYDEKSPIIEVFTSYLPNSNVEHYAWVMDNLFLYVLATIELLAQENFSVVMFVGSTPKSQIPANSLLKRWHQHVDYRLKKNVEAFYIMNPTLYFRTMARLFVSRKVLKKMKYVKSMTELKSFIPTEFLFVPAEIAR